MSRPISGESHCVTTNYACRILKEIGTPLAIATRDHLARGNLKEAVDMKFPEPYDYPDAEAFGKDYMVYNLLRKSSFLDLGIDRTAQAVRAFVESEETCSIFNTYGKTFCELGSITTTSLEVKILLARKEIQRIIGDFTWEDAARYIGFSGGASTGHKRKAGSPFYKFGVRPEVTPGAANLVIEEMKLTPMWGAQFFDKSVNPCSWVKRVAGSRADTVPKNWKTERFICVEPEGNMRMQRGIGGLIRRRLLENAKLDLRKQSRNQELALIGSRTGSLVTIDLKAASDSIALRLVEELLPYSWYQAIFATRSHYTTLDGKLVSLEKVSSMGNGFTFELETLIFWALSRACIIAHEASDQRLAVYGDDIVIHNAVAEPLLELLNYCGFTPNVEKTFINSPFRESCGKHFFYGVDVSPFNISDKCDSEPEKYWLINTYREWRRRFALTDWSSGLTYILSNVRKLAKGKVCYVPPGYGVTSGIESDPYEARTVFSLRRQAYLFRALIPVRQIHVPNGRAATLAWFEANQGSRPSEKELRIMKGDVVYTRFNRWTSRW